MHSFFKNMVLCALFAVLFSTNVHSMQQNTSDPAKRLNDIAMKFQERTNKLITIHKEQKAKQELIVANLTTGNQDTCSCPSAETTEAQK